MRNLKSKIQTRKAEAGGFTLIEMLVTITILMLLAGMLLLATQAANTAAKVAKTKATISKINHFIMMRYDSYRTRRLPLNISSYVTAPPNPQWKSPAGAYGMWSYKANSTSTSWYPTNTPTKNLARARVNAIRDLMRMEMPDRWSDILTGPLVIDPSVASVATQLSPPAPPALTQRYLNAYNSATNLADTAENANFQSAKLLYMIVMSDSEAPHQFSADEVGTVDGTGLPVFLDGWGNPIQFFRWPVGFLPSLGPVAAQNIPATTCDTDLQTGNPTTDHDPFDPNRVFGDAYAVYPLIYSAGPDGYPDIYAGNTPSGELVYLLDSSGDLDPYLPDYKNLLVGQPKQGAGIRGAPALGTLSHFDNIHNQHVEAK